MDDRIRSEFAIREVLTRYCRAVDRLDLDLLKSVYWPDAKDYHGIFNGNALEFADFVLPWLDERYERTQHMLGNVWPQIDGDTARVESYIHAYHREIGSGDLVVLGGRYLDKFDRREGEWRIGERRITLDWEHNGASLLGGADAARTTLARPDVPTADPSYRLFGVGSRYRTTSRT